MSILYPGKMSEEQDKRGAGGGKWRSGGTDRGMHNPFTGKLFVYERLSGQNGQKSEKNGTTAGKCSHKPTDGSV